MKIETESNIFNIKANSELFKTKLFKKNHSFYQTQNTSIASTKFINNTPKKQKNKNIFSKFRIKSYKEEKNSIDENDKKKKKNISRIIFNEFVKKKQLLLNNKANNSTYSINVKYKKGQKQSLIKPLAIPFKDIKLLNIKKIRIKDKILPVLNNNFTNELIKNKNSFLQYGDKNATFVKSKSLNYFKSRKLNLKRNLTSCNINFFNDY
jgi:hypothetical protein